MSANIPVIANWTQTGSAGDALVLSGQNLAPNSNVTVSGIAPNGANFSLTATLESADGTGAVVILPQNLPSDTAFTLSVTNAQGTSNSVTVNAPQVWWVGPDEATQGGVTSIFGQNLILSSSDKPTVTLKMTSGPSVGQTYNLSVVDANAYRVDVQIPSNLPPGAYTVLYNSGAGAGGALDTSQTQAPVLQVSAATSQSSIATINLSNYGGVAGQDDTAAFNAAMNAAQAMIGKNGITQVKIQVGAGIYDISSSIDLGNNIDLEGMGAGQTTIKAASNFTVTGSGAGMLWTNQSQYGTGTVANITIGNMTIDTSGHSSSNVSWSYAPNSSNPFTAIWARSTNDVTINSVTIQAQNGQPLDAAGAVDVTLENSKIVGPAIYFASGSQVFIHGNSFYGTNQSEGSILSQGASDVAVYDNTAQDLDPNPTLSDVLANTSDGRFYVNQPQPGGTGLAVNQYIANNQTNGIGPRASLSSSGADMNVGEQILFEGAGTTTQFSLGSGLFSSSTPTSLELNTASTNISKAGLVGTLTVISGTGAAETTQITGYNSSTGTYTFQTPLAAPLDATSVIQITQGPSQVAIVGNTLQGLAQDVTASGKTETAQSGVEVYPGGANVDIAGNSFVNLPKGVNLWNFNAANGAGKFVGSSFFQIDNNTFTNVNTGVTFVDGYPTGWNLGTLSTADNGQVIGTTIENNNLSSVNQAAFAVITNGGGNAVDVAADNVAGGNVLPSTGSLFEIQGIDGGSQNVLILNNQSTSLPSGSMLAQAITFSTGEFQGSLTSPEFVGYYLTDGSFAENQIASAAGTYGGQAALIATDSGSGNWVGFAAPLTGTGRPIQVLNAGAGDDILVGSWAGGQVLNGGTGDDVFVAATGTASANQASAQLIGGTGADQFVFTSGAQYATNTVTNFNAAKGDEVVLPNLVPTGVNPFTAGYLKIQTSGGGSTLLYDAAGGGTSFVTLGTFTGVTLSPSNIVTGQVPQAPSSGGPTTAPTVTSIVESPATGDLNAGKTVVLTLAFSEAVTVAGGSPALILNDGGTATYASGSGTSALTFNYTVAAGQNTPDLMVTAVNLPTGATIGDSAGNAANLSLSSVTQSSPQIDTTAPVVTGIAESPATGDLNASKTVVLTLAFSEAVTVARGSPTLTLNDGGTATYASGSGTSALTFNYTVAAGQNIASLAATAVNLPSGVTIEDSAGNAASLSLTGLTQAGPQIDTAAPAAPVISSDAVSGNAVTLAGTAEAGSIITVFNGANKLGTATAKIGGAWTYPTGALSTGMQTFTATATDAAGNVSAASSAVDPTIAATTVIAKDPSLASPYVDFNDDGHSDILFQNTSSGQVSISAMNGTSVIGGGTVSANPGPAWKAIGTGDFNGDGHSDILFQNTTTGQASIWEMNGNSLVGGGPVSPYPSGPSWHAIGTGDFNGDGLSDILWQNTNGLVAIWEMNGTHQIASGAVANPGPAWKAIGTGDFNDDGHSDILFQNTTSGQVSIWEMNGTKVIGGGTVSANPGPAWKAIGTGDFNDDGHSDILFQNTTSGQVSIWEMNGNSVIGGGPVSPYPSGASWHAIGTGDFNGDGHSDILWQNANGQAAIWEMNGTNQIASGAAGPNPGLSWLAKA